MRSDLNGHDTVAMAPDAVGVAGMAGSGPASRQGGAPRSRGVQALALAAALSAALSGPTAAHAQAAGRDDAVALVKKAVAHARARGVEQACRDFADPQGGFIQGELYVFVQDMHAKMVCHGANKRMNGKDLSQLKDANGKFFSRDMAALAKARGAGWVDYQWINPATQALEPKASYIERVDDATWLGVGIYRK